MIKLTSILVEGRYSKIVSDWTKEIVKIIKSFLSSKKDYLLKTLNKQWLKYGKKNFPNAKWSF